MKSISKVAKRTAAYLAVVLPLLSAAACLFAPAVSAQANTGADTSVYSMGPGGGGAIVYANINPQDDDNIMLSCDMASTFISKDGGASFKSHLFWDFTKFDYNPHDPNIVYAYNRQQVYISRDKGETFGYFAPKAAAIDKIGNNMQLPNAQNNYSKVIYNADAYFSGTGLSNIDGHRISKVYVDPSDPNIIYILIDGYNLTTIPMKLAKSVDGGETFSIIASGFASIHKLRNDAYGVAIVTSSNPAIGEQTLTTRFSDFLDMLAIGDRLYIMGNNGICVLNSSTGAVITEKLIKSRWGQFVYSGGVLTTYIIPANEDVLSADPEVAKAAKKANGLEIQKSVGTDFNTWMTFTGGDGYQTNFYGKLQMHDGRMVQVVNRAPVFTMLKVAATDPNIMYVHFNSGFGNNALRIASTAATEQTTARASP
jgi:hypothetical protein